MLRLHSILEVGTRVSKRKRRMNSCDELRAAYCATRRIDDFVSDRAACTIHPHAGGSMAKKAARKSAKKSAAKKSTRKTAKRSMKKSAKKTAKRGASRKSTKKASRR
jgi:hypothetical protein